MVAQDVASAVGRSRRICAAASWSGQVRSANCVAACTASVLTECAALVGGGVRESMALPDAVAYPMGVAFGWPVNRTSFRPTILLHDMSNISEALFRMISIRPTRQVFREPSLRPWLQSSRSCVARRHYPGIGTPPSVRHQRMYERG